MKEETGVTRVPIEAASELVQVVLTANSPSVEFPFTPNSGRRQRYLVGIRTFTRDLFSTGGLPSQPNVPTLAEAAYIRFTLRDSDGMFLVKDMPYLACRSARIVQGDRVKVFDRLPVDFDKSFVQTAGRGAAMLASFEFIYAPDNGQLS